MTVLELIKQLLDGDAKPNDEIRCDDGRGIAHVDSGYCEDSQTAVAWLFLTDHEAGKAKEYEDDNG